MDKSYYFVLEPGGSDEGPYNFSEVRRRIALGLVSREASLCKVGDTDWTPVKHDRYAALLEPLPVAPAQAPVTAPRRASGTIPPALPQAIASAASTAAGFAAAPALVEPAAPDAAPDAAPAPAFTAGAPVAVPAFASPAPAPVAPARAPAPAPSFAAVSAPAPALSAPASAPAFDAPAPALDASAYEAPAPAPARSFAASAPAVAAPARAVAASAPAFPAPAFAASAQAFAAPAPVPAPVVAGPTPATRAVSSQTVAVSMAEADVEHTVPVNFIDPIDVDMPIEAAPVAAAPRVEKRLALRAPQTPAAAKPRKISRRLAWGLAGGGVAALAAASAAMIASSSKDVTVKDAMVHVTTPSGTGAGFFIQGPDDYAYVATANHIVDRGEQILVERDVGTDKHAFVEAYPQTEVVASDPDADLAIIRIKNVKASRFTHLPLAKEPTKDARILAFGYPGSSLAKHAGLVSKDGKVLSLASFPAYDQRYARIIRENAVDGLLISADIEPGFSGGPTCNEAGAVVGVNVTKDRAHVGQNGAVSVVALRKLLEHVRPASDHSVPTTADVAKLLEKIQSEYLLLPLDERSKVRETEFVNRSDLPILRRLVGEVRREERNTDTSSFAKYRLSGQAALGIYFARLPGKLLETYRSPTTTTPLVACELANQHLTSFLGDLSPADTKVEERRQSAFETCDELAVRPLAWDLVAATLQWDGREKQYSVTKLERMDEEEQIYRASVRISGASNLIELWLAVDQHDLRLKLFDSTESLYAIKSPRTVQPAALQGTWAINRPRVTDAINKDAEIESSETLAISVGDDRKVSIRHVVTERYFGAGNRLRQFKCSGKKTIETGLLQSFTGNLDNGVIVALPDKPAEIVGADAGYCEPSHKADRIVAIKLSGDQLTLYRTDGNAYPETIQLAKQ